ncbi:hypothetical protein [Lactococcus protaetiae]|uniref:Uncharacterized protein n=1 Tax=Lactococcus protaetiae TaxID=2592653 RepID=A0A514Z6D8_9LACT|nr:hypothetical protein [Lactococcus protaetiae]QDK70165.1 hypothetical protein FLP15_01950 [Lactococcus protaetiae]
MALKTTDLTLNNWQENEYQVTQVKEWTDFNNDRAHLGWQYEIVLPRLRFEKVFVKVPGDNPLFTNADVMAAGTKTVKFEHLDVSFYARTSKGSEFVELLLSGKADKINLALNKKVD